MFKLSWKKYFAAFGFLLLIVVFLKYAVDVCLPGYEDSKVFWPKLPAPEFICKPTIEWDVWARTRDAEIASRANWQKPAPGVFQSDEGDPDLLVFGKDVLKLTVLLTRVPLKVLPTLELLAICALLSFLVAIVWHWLDLLIGFPEVPKGSRIYRRRSTAFRTLLPHYLRRDDAGFEEPRGKPEEQDYGKDG